MIRNPGDYPTEATSGAGQRHHQVVEVGEVLDRVMSGGTLSAGLDYVKRTLRGRALYPPTRFIPASTASTSGEAMGG